METMGNFKFGDEYFQLDRYPPTEQRSLQAWCAADELLLRFTKDRTGKIAIYGDVFGSLSVCLNTSRPTSIVTSRSQIKALEINSRYNNCPEILNLTAFPLGSLNERFNTVLMRIPKSLDLFELFLQQSSAHLEAGGQVACGFMTKYFTPGLVAIAERYFDCVEQSRAEHKARLLILSSPKEIEHKPLIHSMDSPWGQIFKQYYGVFSSGHLDFASLFLIEHLSVSESELTILDLASGNGVLACAAQRANPSAKIYLVDDSWLAVESSKLNIPDAHFVWDDSLSQFDKSMFDLIISNPPFHFGHETNIEVSLHLFAQAANCLKPNGRFVIVANSHLNYAVHLLKWFSSVDTIAENEKFVIYESML